MRSSIVLAVIVSLLGLSGCSSFVAARDEYKLAVKHLPQCMKNFGGQCQASSTRILASQQDLDSHYAIDSLAADDKRDTWSSVSNGFALLNALSVSKGKVTMAAPKGARPFEIAALANNKNRLIVEEDFSKDASVAFALQALQDLDFRFMSEEVARAAIEVGRQSLIEDCNVAKFRRLAGHSIGDSSAVSSANGRCAQGLASTGKNGNVAEFEFTRAGISDTFKKIEIATSLDAYDYLALAALRAYVDTLVSVTIGTATKENAAAYRGLFLESTFLAIYYREYFRKGDFFLVTFDHSSIDKTIESKLREWFIKKVPHGEYVEEDRMGKCASAGNAAQIEICKTVQRSFAELLKKSIDEIRSLLPGLEFDESGKATVIGKLSEGGFISRSGAKLSVPDFTVNIDLLAENKVDSSEVDFVAVGNDLVRVFTEAVGDSIFGVPGDPGSTGCKNDLLDCFIENNPSQGGLDTGQFVKVNEKAEKADAITRAAAGRLIRGISWFSLGNEALAEMIESFLAGASRKAVEKTFWCLEACSNTSPSGAQVRTVIIGIDD